MAQFFALLIYHDAICIIDIGESFEKKYYKSTLDTYSIFILRVDEYGTFVIKF